DRPGDRARRVGQQPAQLVLQPRGHRSPSTAATSPSPGPASAASPACAASPTPAASPDAAANPDAAASPASARSPGWSRSLASARAPVLLPVPRATPSDWALSPPDGPS